MKNESSGVFKSINLNQLGEGECFLSGTVRKRWKKEM